MFARIKDRLCGNKKNVSIIPSSTPKKKGKRNGAGRTNAAARPISQTCPDSLDFNDEFRRNDVDGFEMVIVDRNHIQQNAEAVGTIKPPQNTETEPSTLPVETKHAEEAEVIIVAEGDGNSIGSLVDFAARKNHDEKSNSNAEVSLSSDEMQVMDMFDSVMDGFANLDENYESVDDNVSDSDAIHGHAAEDNDNMKLFETSGSDKSKVEDSIDYHKVFGDTIGSQSESIEARNNWQITECHRQKSFRFVAKAGMYLPSPQMDPAPKSLGNVPELPPADYPKTEESEPGCQEDDINERSSNEQESKDRKLPSPAHSPPTMVTSFSRGSKGQLSNTDVSKSAGSRSTVSSRTSEIDIDSGDKNLKTVVKNSETTSTGTAYSSYDGKVIISEKRDNVEPQALHKRLKPRVTSFKSSNLPSELTSRPVNDLVKKFETFPVGEAF